MTTHSDLAAAIKRQLKEVRRAKENLHELLKLRIDV